MEILGFAKKKIIPNDHLEGFFLYGFCHKQKKKMLQPRKSWHASPIEEKKNGKPRTKKKFVGSGVD